MIEDDDLLEKYNTLWDKVSADWKKKNLTVRLCLIKVFLKTKIKSRGNEVTYFNDKREFLRAYLRNSLLSLK